MINQSDDTIVIGMLALCRFSGVHPRMFSALMAHYGSLERILRADAGSLMAVSGLSAEAANEVAKASSRTDQAAAYLDLLRSQDIKVISNFDAHYPARLYELNDPPPILYFTGGLPDGDLKTVAVAGTHNASTAGIELTAAVAKKMAGEGVQVVSALKQGVSATALLAAKSAGGRAFAVLNSGLQQIEPAENHPLARDVIENGGLISEYPPDRKADKKHHQAANRIIAAMAQAVLVTEFYRDSEETLDLLTCCSQIGKLLFVLVDPRPGALTDKEAFDKAVSCGAIAQVGLDSLDDIIKSLV